MMSELSKIKKLGKNPEHFVTHLKIRNKGKKYEVGDKISIVSGENKILVEYEVLSVKASKQEIHLNVKHLPKRN